MGLPPSAEILHDSALPGVTRPTATLAGLDGSTGLFQHRQGEGVPQRILPGDRDDPLHWALSSTARSGYAGSKFFPARRAGHAVVAGSRDCVILLLRYHIFA